ncbi:hypothetical protein NT6N_31510 [Oceaniferula spumae]|uniref:Uncharacterized protein n=1 Tax=Oceaniferula spumae TaxID=2979115 RepID=A0AAT9FQ08_9BACT
MATQKKGCGFLITALVLLLLGGGIAAYLGMSAVSSGKDFVEDIEKGEVFVTPGTLNYTPEEDGEVTVWITGDGSTDLNPIVIEVTDVAAGTTTNADKPGGSSTMGNQHLVAKFSVKKGQTYQVKATGVGDGYTFRVSNLSSSVVLSMIGKGVGAFGVFGVCGFLALIFGIIGLVKFLGSKNKQPVAASPGPPAV